MPKGLAHGYISLEENTIFAYKVDSEYNRESERGIHFDSEGLAIDWPIPKSELLTSKKDQNLPLFGANDNFKFG